MNKLVLPLLFIAYALPSCLTQAYAQRDSLAVAKDTMAIDSVVGFPERITITVMAPFFLDSLYKSGDYRYAGNIPRFALPALEFYNGVQTAADWLETEAIPVDIQILDTRRNNDFVKAAAAPELNASQLIIAMVQSSGELRTLAAQARQRDIPFISATYPNDGNVTATPNMIILNSTLVSHCESVYRYLQTNHPLDNLILLSRKSSAGDFIRNSLVEMHNSAKGTKLAWREVVMADDEDPTKLLPYLDSTKTNTIVVSSLYEPFAKTLIKKLSSLQKTYSFNVFGMPTWDGYKLTGSDYAGVNIYYTTPFADGIGNPELNKAVVKHYKLRANSEPSDLAIRGFEATYRFVKTLYHHLQTPQFLSSLNDKEFQVFSNFNFKAITNSSGAIDYYENKHLYMVHVLDGVKKSIR